MEGFPRVGICFGHCGCGHHLLGRKGALKIAFVFLDAGWGLGPLCVAFSGLRK